MNATFGNITSDTNPSLTFAERRTTDGGALQERIDYKYDVFGGLIERVSTLTGTERRAYDGMTVWADLDGANNVVTRRIFGAGEEPVARITVGGATAAWYLLDRQGSVRDMTDNTGAIQYTATYGGFGNIESETNPGFGDRYKYTGQEKDAATGFQLHWWRWYDPASGRWTSQDPIRFPGGNANLYGYVGNGPTNGIDSSGLFDEALFWENVEKLAPDVKKWFQNELGGKVVQRDWGVFRWNVTGTWKTTDAGTEKIMYISSHYDEIEAAKQFIDYATTGYWFASDWNAKDLDKPDLPGSHEKWREWYAKEVKRVGQIGLDVMKGYYGIALKGADWVLTVNDIVEGEGSLESYLTLINLARVMPRAKNTAFKMVDKSGKVLAKINPKTGKLLGHNEYRVTDAAKAGATQKELMAYYKKYSKGNIKLEEGLSGAQFHTQSGNIRISQEIADNYPHLFEGYLVEELKHFQQVRERGWLGRRLTKGEEKLLEDEVVGFMKKSGFEIFDPRKR